MDPHHLQDQILTFWLGTHGPSQQPQPAFLALYYAPSPSTLYLYQPSQCVFLNDIAFISLFLHIQFSLS